MSSSTTSASIRLCTVCDKPGDQQCSACRAIFFCSTRCQKLVRPPHNQAHQRGTTVLILEHLQLGPTHKALCGRDSEAFFFPPPQPRRRRSPRAHQGQALRRARPARDVRTVPDADCSRLLWSLGSASRPLCDRRRHWLAPTTLARPLRSWPHLSSRTADSRLMRRYSSRSSPPLTRAHPTPRVTSSGSTRTIICMWQQTRAGR